jgi:hypothetical protein
MFLPKDSFRARILNRKALGWFNFADRAAACKQARISHADNSARAFGAGKYGDSAADSCVSEAPP